MKIIKNEDVFLNLEEKHIYRVLNVDGEMVNLLNLNKKKERIVYIEDLQNEKIFVKVGGIINNSKTD